MQQKASDTAANVPHDFDTATQWRRAFLKLINDSEFRRVEAEEVAIRVLTQLTTLDGVLGGNVEIARQHGEERSAAEAHWSS